MHKDFVEKFLVYFDGVFLKWNFQDLQEMLGPSVFENGLFLAQPGIVFFIFGRSRVFSHFFTIIFCVFFLALQAIFLVISRIIILSVKQNKIESSPSTHDQGHYEKQNSCPTQLSPSPNNNPPSSGNALDQTSCIIYYQVCVIMFTLCFTMGQSRVMPYTTAGHGLAQRKNKESYSRRTEVPLQNVQADSVHP